MQNTITYHPVPGYQSHVDAVLARGWVGDDLGEKQFIGDGISGPEADVLTQIILDHNCKRCLETGVSRGISTLAITQAAARLGGHLDGVDPFQADGHHNAALCLLAEHGLGDRFTLHEGPSHLMLPALLARDAAFDFIFIDGMHTFQYKLLDYFYADQLLPVGGWMVFHDLVLPSVKKVLRFVLNEHKYELWTTPGLAPSWPRKARYVAGAVLKGRSLNYYWPNGFSNLLVLRKRSAEERPWDYFRAF